MSVNGLKLGFASSRLRRTTIHLLLIGTLVLINAVSYSSRRAQAQSASDDPICGNVQRQMSSASDGTNGDRFGQSVAVDGDTIVVGAPYDTLGPVERQGTAYVFVRNGSRWTERARLFPSDGAPDDNFGWSVAISGNLIVVGAPGNNIDAVTDQGAAYVFHNSGGSWFEQQRLLALDGAAGDLFGYSVAISGGNVAIGAATADINGKRNQGAVYRFQPTGAAQVWTQGDKLTAEDGAADDLFGSSVALSGNVLLVGAPGDTIGLKQAQGSAHIFGDSNLPLRPHPKLIASDGEAEDKFGSSVAIDDGTVIVGAPYDRIVNFNRQGSASVFVRGGTALNPVWLFQSKLIDEYYAAPDDFFGVSVALKGDLALVGASQMIESGKTLLFSRDGTVWTVRQKHTPSGEASSDHFGYDVAFARDGLIIGAFAAGTADQGAFYFFENNCMVTVSAASYDGTQQAPESIVSGFGRNLSSEALSANEQPLPTTLGDTRVRFYDSLGTRRFAPLFYVSPGQINFQVPAGTALGEATVLVDRNGEVAAGRVMITNVAPGLFTANADGGSVPAALAFRLKESGAQSYEPLAKFDSALARYVLVPIDLGPSTDQLFLVLYGTGIRFRSSLTNVSATIGGLASEVLAAEAAPGFVGLDQVNVRLSRALIGRGEVDVTLLVDGRAANIVRVNIR